MTHSDNIASRFTEVLWPDIGDIVARVLTHPFITGLMDGTLPRESFRHYIVQDSHYLRVYSRVLALCAGRADEIDDTTMLARHATGSVAMELGMHAELLTELGTGPAEAAEEPIGPTTQAYLDFLIASAYDGSFGEAIGAVLPCYWVGAKIGEALRTNSSPDPLYARWIDTYADEAFQDVVDEVLTATDRIGARISGRERVLVRTRVRTAARYEWMFWDASYRCETWPV